MKSNKRSNKKLVLKIGHNIEKQIGLVTGQKIEQKIGREIGQKIRQEIGQEVESGPIQESRTRWYNSSLLMTLQPHSPGCLTDHYPIKFSRPDGRMPISSLFISQVPRTLRLTTETLTYFQFCPRCWKNVSFLEFVIMLSQSTPLNPLQHGFRPNRSCVSRLIQHVNFLASSLDNGGKIDNIYLDMAKAFDSVPHQKLLCKLRYYGFRDPLLSWIADYLTNRRHCVIIDGSSSCWKPDTSDVLQGFLIGPSSFLKPARNHTSAVRWWCKIM